MSFVFFSTQAWDEMDGAGRPTHYLARELLRRGEAVLFVQPFASRAPAADPKLTLAHLGELGMDEHALRRAWFGLDPQVDLVTPFHRVLDAFAARGGDNTVLYGDPFVPFVALFPLLRERGFKIVYHALDDFEAFSEIGLYFANRAAERFLVAQSDLVTAVSTTLVEKLSAWQPRAPIQLLRQGYDPATFRRAPSPSVRHTASDNAANAHITLGFWGHVNAFNVDVELITAIAAARPLWTIQLIGPVDLDPTLPPVGPRLREHANIALVGRVPHEALPGYLENFDVGLVPFPNNAFNRARDPLKVLEYLSGYRPIAAAHTPQLAGTPYVFLGDTPQEYLAAIETALKTELDVSRVNRYLDESTWSKRLEQLECLLAPITPPRATVTPDIAAWYQDAGMSANVREYIARTEQLLAERTEFVRALQADGNAKQNHIERLQQTNPFWRLKSIFN